MIFRLAIRALLARPLTFVLATGILAVSTILLFGATVLPGALEKSLTAPAGDFDAVLGPRGSKAQLVLSTVFHLDTPAGTIPEAELDRLKRHPAVLNAHPVAMGDNYEGFRLLGCRSELVELYQGSNDNLEGFDEIHHPGAILGAYAASETGLKVGDHFSPVHGLTEHADHNHEDEFHVTAILPSKGHPVDRLILVPLDAMRNLDGHRAEASEEVSAILLSLRPGGQMMAMQLDRNYNRSGGNMTLAWPVPRVVAELIASLAWLPKLAVSISVVFALVATASLFALLLLMTEMQRGLLAQLRIFGVSRSSVIWLLVLQAFAFVLSGFLAGSIGYIILSQGVTGWLLADQGMLVGLLPSFSAFATALGGLVVIALIALVWPLWQSYRIDLEAQLRSLE